MSIPTSRDEPDQVCRQIDHNPDENLELALMFSLLNKEGSERNTCHEYTEHYEGVVGRRTRTVEVISRELAGRNGRKCDNQGIRKITRGIYRLELNS